MMYGSGSYTSLVWLSIHCFFGLLALFGTIAAIIWIAKYAKKETLKTIVWTTLIVGILGSIITVPMASRGWYDMMSQHRWGWGSELDEEDFETMFEYMFEDLDETEAEEFRDDMEEIMDDMMGDSV